MELTLEQRKMIHSKPSRCSLIKGIQGSGKTTAAIYRGLYLKNQYCLYEEDKILMLASGEEDINYIESIYSLAEGETKLDYLSIFSNSERKFQVVTLESIILKYFLEYKNKYKFESIPIIDNNKKNRIMKNCILEIKNMYPRLKILHNDYVEFFIEEVKWIKSFNYIKIEDYLLASRTGRNCEKSK